ncbi:DUF4374 domain-containing protein [Sphingobacterium sp. lm-10]|uniref:DUF4374 domain-containing protein n=1 Tax=Sphingobacterium sp. lm-10 TaxID=2944904 RepID=UPI002021E780|nr:DUF4374 domain-containing protein [Sphingobacterium sp. lm-10]MCL7988193.1 DUF4374 domain-containing protein [Sphingobacterium sp. lm-10]
MNLKFTKSSMLAWTAIGILAASCSDNNNLSDRDSNDVEFFVAANSGNGSYLLAVPDVTAGEASVVGQGLETEPYTAWVFPNPSTGIGLRYQQGDPGLGIGVTLGPTGNIIRKGSDFQIISRFTTYGPFQNQVLTIVGSVQSQDNPNALFSTFNFINPENNNSVRTVTKSTTNLTGNGEYGTLSGVVPFGSQEFLTAIVPARLARNASGQLSTSATAYPDSVWIAALDADLNVKRIYRDNRLGYASGRFRSQYYSSIAEDGKGNVYVFSPANDANSTKPAGVIRIRSGQSTFDPDYFYNLRDQAANLIFQRVYHVHDDWFALAYVRPGSTAQTGPAQPNALALVNVVTKSFQWVGGLPDFNGNPRFGLPISEGGKLYIPVSETNEKPAIYIVDAATGQASKGLVVNADEITAIGKLAK